MAKKSGYVQSVDRALSILDLFVEYPALSIGMVAQKLNLAKTTVFGLMATLEKNDYITQQQVKGDYEIGMKVFRLSSAVTSRMNIVHKTSELLVPLTKRHGHNAHITLLDGLSVVYMDSIMPSDAVYVKKAIGSRSSAFSTSSGKALLACLPEAEREKRIAEYTFEPYTKNTIMDPDQFRMEMQRIRLHGYSIDNQENVEGIMGVSVAVLNTLDQPVLGISMSGLAAQFTPELISEYYNALNVISERIRLLVGTNSNVVS